MRIESKINYPRISQGSARPAHSSPSARAQGPVELGPGLDNADDGHCIRMPISYRGHLSRVAQGPDPKKFTMQFDAITYYLIIFNH
jgi:hypothetical protein